MRPGCATRRVPNADSARAVVAPDRQVDSRCCWRAARRMRPGHPCGMGGMSWSGAAAAAGHTVIGAGRDLHDGRRDRSWDHPADTAGRRSLRPVRLGPGSTIGDSDHDHSRCTTAPPAPSPPIATHRGRPSCKHLVLPAELTAEPGQPGPASNSTPRSTPRGLWAEDQPPSGGPDPPARRVEVAVRTVIASLPTKPQDAHDGITCLRLHLLQPPAVVIAEIRTA